MSVSKFTFFIVKCFSVLLLAAIVMIFIKKMTNNDPGAAFDKTVLPKCDLAALSIGTPEQFLQQLDRLYETGGIKAVRAHVEKEFVPGRKIVIGSTLAGEASAEMILLDREIRRCDGEGSTLINIPPVLDRAKADIHAGDDAQLHTWPRLALKQPYSMTVWWVPQVKKKAP